MSSNSIALMPIVIMTIDRAISIRALIVHLKRVGCDTIQQQSVTCHALCFALTHHTVSRYCVMYYYYNYTLSLLRLRHFTIMEWLQRVLRVLLLSLILNVIGLKAFSYLNEKHQLQTKRKPHDKTIPNSII